MAVKRSAGILLYRGSPLDPDVLLVHPGGPFWSKKDDGAWFIPKGELESGEDAWMAARREFREELGCDPPRGEAHALGNVTNKSGKRIECWALEGDYDCGALRSNLFTLEWPPRSGVMREFPEVDQAQFFSSEQARRKIHVAELPFLERLRELLAGRAASR